MKSIITFLLIGFIIFSNANSQAQKVNVIWGPEQKIATNKREQSYLIGHDGNGGMYSLREISGAITRRFIEHYDQNGILLKSRKFRIKNEGGTQFFGGIFFNEGKMYLLTYRFKISNRINSLCIQDIDPVSLTVSKNFQTKVEAPYKWQPFQFQNQFYLREANDKIYVVNIAPDLLTDGTVICINVFDKEFNLQWKHFQGLEYDKNLFRLEDYDIDRNETIRVMASIYEDKNIKVRQGKPNYTYHFFEFSNQGEKYSEYKVSLGDKLITDMRFTYRSNEDIICAGFYSDEYSLLKTNTIAGAFYITLDPNSPQIKLENYLEFDRDFLSNFMSADKAEKGKEIKNIILYNLHLMEDGSVILLAEEYSQFEINTSITFTSTSSHSTQWGTYYTTTVTTYTSSWTNFYYDNIIAIKGNPDGIIEWAKIIPKKQHTAADGGIYSSFATAYVRDKIYLIYNDNPRNLTATVDDVYAFRKNNDAVVVCAEIGGDGNISKNALFSAREAEILTCPGSCRQISDNQMEIYGKRGNKFKWGILDFQ
ncbi:MAG: hypothetical protein JXB49_10980 [Bacteroidales bacterium]|nr:hypothetical protein [Bacteroidales bacterium]